MIFPPNSCFWAIRPGSETVRWGFRRLIAIDGNGLWAAIDREFRFGSGSVLRISPRSALSGLAVVGTVNHLVLTGYTPLHQRGIGICNTIQSSKDKFLRLL